MTASVVSPAERGRRGYDVMVKRYSKATRTAWARRGGRKPNPTLAEIEAGQLPKRAKATKGKTVPRGRDIKQEGPIATRFS